MSYLESPLPPRFSGMNTVAGSGSTLSGGGSGRGDGLSAMCSDYRQSERPKQRLGTKTDNRGLERKLETIDDGLVLDVAIARAVRDAQLRLRDVLRKWEDAPEEFDGLQKQAA